MFDDEIDSAPSPRQHRIAESVGEVLREEVPVRDEWRAGVLRDIARLNPPLASALVLAPRRSRRWEIRPLTALAAGILCAVVGAGAAAFMLARDPRVGGARAALEARGEAAAVSTVRFVLVAPYASRVSLVGDFNRWNPRAMPMRRSPDGRTWTVDVPLTPGRHLYSFLVDGDLAPDPAAPRAGDDDFGVPSSVILVSGGRT
jgi:hypothetical protein